MYAPVAKARGKVAGLHARPETDPEKIEARRALRAAKLESYVLKVISDAPPLTNEQAARIAALLTAGGAA